MGRESSVEKDRNCLVCQRTWFTTAKEMTDHTLQCKRLQAIGLELPADVGNLVRPAGGIILP